MEFLEQQVPSNSNSVNSAAYYSAVAEFAHWVEKHSDLKLVSWLQSHVQANPELGLAYLTDRLTEAIADLDRNWNIKAVDLNGVPALGDDEQEADPEAVMTLPTIKCLLATDPNKTSQKFISNHIQEMLQKRLFDDLDQSGQQRLCRVRHHLWQIQFHKLFLSALRRLGWYNPPWDICLFLAL